MRVRGTVANSGSPSCSARFAGARTPSTSELAQTTPGLASASRWNAATCSRNAGSSAPPRAPESSTTVRSSTARGSGASAARAQTTTTSPSTARHATSRGRTSTCSARRASTDASSPRARKNSPGQVTRPESATPSGYATSAAAIAEAAPSASELRMPGASTSSAANPITDTSAPTASPGPTAASALATDARGARSRRCSEREACSNAKLVDSALATSSSGAKPASARAGSPSRPSSA